MNTREKILRMIANTSIMYVYHIKENGLLHGKTGVMYYLYLYAQIPVMRYVMILPGSFSMV